MSRPYESPSEPAATERSVRAEIHQQTLDTIGQLITAAATAEVALEAAGQSPDAALNPSDIAELRELRAVTTSDLCTAIKFAIKNKAAELTTQEAID